MLVRAFLTETTRSFDLNGRTARARYLSFLFVATLLYASAIWLCFAFLAEGYAATGVYLVTALFYLPVTAAGVRRLHDVGESGTLMLDPLKPAAAFGILLCLLGVLSLSSAGGLIVTAAAVFLFGKVIVAVFSIAALLGVALTLMYFSNTMGLLLLPSQPGKNQYGPNPHEVLA